MLGSMDCGPTAFDVGSNGDVSVGSEADIVYTLIGERSSSTGRETAYQW